MTPIPATTQLPGYQLLRILGSGAGGVVWLALDERNNRLRAVKQFVARGQAAQRFFQELGILLSLDHPNIIRCQDLVYCPAGKHSLVLEYANGGSLRDVLPEDRGLPAFAVIPIALQIARGLAHAHERHFIHCDLKAENILLSREEGQETWKIADMGVAQNLNALDEEAVQGSGSPGYMAPEQFYDKASQQSDLYSLGILIFEMVTGHLPFEGLPPQLFLAHLHEPLPLDEIEHQGLRELIGQLSSKQPEQRPKTAAWVVEALADLLPQPRPSALAVPAPVVPIAASLLRVEEVTVRLLATCSTPGARTILADPVHNLFLLPDDRFTDAYDPVAGRLQVHALPESVRAVIRDPRHPGDLLVAGRRSLYHVAGSSHSPRRAFDLLFAPLAMVTGQGSLVLADSRHIHCCSPFGRHRWTSSVANYGSAPQLLAREDAILVSSGPVAPSVKFLSWSDGAARHTLPLPSPIFHLGIAARTGEVSAACAGLGSEEPTRLYTLCQGESSAVREFPEGIFAVELCGPFYAFLRRGRRLLLGSLEGRAQIETALAGDPIAMAWLPELRLLAVLQSAQRRKQIAIYRLDPTGAQLPTPSRAETAIIHL